MRTLDWFRSIGNLTPTRYPDLYVWHQDRGTWRFVIDSEDGAWESSAWYRTKAEAFSMVSEAADQYGITTVA